MTFRIGLFDAISFYPYYAETVSRDNIWKSLLGPAIVTGGRASSHLCTGHLGMRRASDPEADRNELGKAPVPERTEAERRPRKQVYLRTVYPLNPGIPHFVDVPGGW